MGRLHRLRLTDHKLHVPLLRGPMQDCPRECGYRYGREAPHLGLTGVAEIMMTRKAINADAVAYDLNLACHIPARARGGWARLAARLPVG